VKHGNHYCIYMTSVALQGIFILNTGTDQQYLSVCNTYCKYTLGWRSFYKTSKTKEGT